MTLNTAEVMPIPKAKVRTAIPLNTGWRDKLRIVHLRCWDIPPPKGGIGISQICYRRMSLKERVVDKKNRPLLGQMCSDLDTLTFAPDGYHDGYRSAPHVKLQASTADLS